LSQPQIIFLTQIQRLVVQAIGFLPDSLEDLTCGSIQCVSNDLLDA